MRTVTKLLFLLIAFMLGYNPAYSQTQADVRLGEILNSGDLFLLKNEYPDLKDSVSVKMLDFIAEAQLGIGFNKLENAAVALDSLLMHHQNEIGAETSIGLAALQGPELFEFRPICTSRKSGRESGQCIERVRAV